MFAISVFFSLLVIITNYDVIGVVYNIGEDSNRTLNICGPDFPWNQTEYSAIGIKGILGNDKGIRASEYSCAKTDLIYLLPGTTLDIIVYLETKQDKSGLLVVVTDENSVEIIRYFYNKSIKEYVNGWCKLSIRIKWEGLGYINLIGYSDYPEVVIIDSIQYTLRTDEPQDVLLRNGQIDYIDPDDNDYLDVQIPLNKELAAILEAAKDITGEQDSSETNEIGDDNGEESEEAGSDSDSENNGENNGNYTEEEESEEGSGEEIESTTEIISETTSTTQQPVVTNPPEEIIESAGLSTWIIALIVLASGTGLALVAVCAYHLGKNRGLAENPLIFDDVTEPRSAVSIPRVRGVAESPIHIIDRPNFN